jgi:microcystin-dependent protein
VSVMGSLAINTSSPSHSLEVVGTGYISSSLNVSGTAYLGGLSVGAVSYCHVPSFVIVMWYGTALTVPTGWAICDGTNGTPDLRDRFVVGVGTSYALSATGGRSTVTLTGTELPAHTHTGTTAAGGSHTHTGSTNAGDGSHRHNMTVYLRTAGVSGTNTNQATGAPNTNTLEQTKTWISDNDSLSDHQHGFTTDSSTTHTHTFTTGSTGTGSAFNILNPFFALYFIMKL